MSRFDTRVRGPSASAVAVGGGPAAAGLGVAVALLGVLAVAPLAAVAVGATGARVAAADVVPVVLGSLILALASTAATLALAAPLAYAVASADVPGRRPLAVAARLPLLAPPFTAGLAVLVLLGPRARGLAALVVAQALTFVPHAYVLLASGLGALNRDREAAAESLGAGAWTTFRRVTFPVARPALRAATLVVFLLSLADLGNPLLVGAEHPVLAREVYARAVVGQDAAGASALALVLVVPCLVAWWLDRGRPVPIVWSQAALGRVTAWRPTPPRVRWALAIAGGLVTTVVTGAVLVVVVASVVAGAGDWSPSVTHWSTLAAATDARAVGGSLAVAVVAGGAGSALALVLAYLMDRPRLPGAAAVRTLAMLPAMVPGLMLGLGYVILLGGPPATATTVLVAATASIVAWKLPGGLQVAGETLARIDPATEAAALGLGAGRARTLARVVLPPLATTALVVFAFFFVNGLVTVATVAFLLSPALELAAPAALARAAAGSVGEACALVTLLLAVVTVAVLALRALAGRARVAALFL